MKLYNDNADIFIPDQTDLETALQRTTHMAVLAHQDDTEISSYHGIAECFGQKDKWFSSVIVTNGAGSPRAGIYADYTDEDMQNIRLKEQRKAALLGEYSIQVQLGYPSSAVKDPQNKNPVDDIYQLLQIAQPSYLYLHNPADKHPTHVATLLRAIDAVRKLPDGIKPDRVYGCEEWRDLDWLTDNEKIVLDVSAYENLSTSLVSLFDSQISGGKRYDLATTGRRLANATYFDTHNTDKIKALTFAIDLTPLIKKPYISVKTYICEAIDRFRKDVEKKLDLLI